MIRPRRKSAAEIRAIDLKFAALNKADRERILAVGYKQWEAEVAAKQKAKKGKR